MGKVLGYGFLSILAGYVLCMVMAGLAGNGMIELILVLLAMALPGMLLGVLSAVRERQNVLLEELRALRLQLEEQKAEKPTE